MPSNSLRRSALSPKLAIESFDTRKISGSSVPHFTINAHNSSQNTKDGFAKVDGSGNFSLTIKSKKGDTVELQLQAPGSSSKAKLFVRNDGKNAWSTLAAPTYVGEPVQIEQFWPTNQHTDENGEPAIELAHVTGPLFIRGVNVADVEQGSINNCYLACGLSLLAHFRPEAVQSAIKELPDGNFEVTLFEGKYRPKPLKVTVNSDLFLDDDGEPIYTHSSTGELWPMILEKAYAEHVGEGSYEAIGQGGKAGDVIFAFTGEPYMMHQINDAHSGEEVFENISQTVKAGRPASAGTYSDKDRYKDVKIYANHNYAILDTGNDPKDNKPYLLLRNPWGRAEPDYRGENDGKDDGIFKITLEDFLQYFSTYSVVTQSRQR